MSIRWRSCVSSWGCPARATTPGEAPAPRQGHVQRLGDEAGAHVVGDMIAVPHEAFEAVREEPDMAVRVWHLRIDPWSQDELQLIASLGLGALNVGDDGESIGQHLARNSLGRPF